MLYFHTTNMKCECQNRHDRDISRFRKSHGQTISLKYTGYIQGNKWLAVWAKMSKLSTFSRKYLIPIYIYVLVDNDTIKIQKEI